MVPCSSSTPLVAYTRDGTVRSPTIRACTATAGGTRGPRQFDDGLVVASPLDSPLSLGPEAAAVPRWGRFKRQDFEGHEDGGSRVYAIIAPAMRSSRCGSAQNVLGSIVT